MDCYEVEIWSSSSHHPSSSSSFHHPHIHNHRHHHHHPQHPHLEGRGWLVIRWGVGRRLPLNCHPQAPGQPNPELENIQPPKCPIFKSMLNQLKKPSPWPTKSWKISSPPNIQYPEVCYTNKQNPQAPGQPNPELENIQNIQLIKYTYPKVNR